MRPLMRYLIGVTLLLSVTAATRAQAGRYIPIPLEPIPIPARPGGGLPFAPHLPWHVGGDSDFWKYIAAAVCILGAAGFGWTIGQGLAEKRAPGSTRWAPGPDVPAPDLIHPAWDVAPKAERTHRLMEFLAHRDPLFDPSALRGWVEQRFLEVQDAWQKGDYGPLGGLLLPAIRVEHESQLAMMRANGERNVLGDLSVERLEFVHLDCPADPDRQELTALITFLTGSHYVDARTGAFRRGSRVPTRFQEFWVFRRHADAWHLAAIQRSHDSTRLERPNHVEELTEDQREHAEQCITL